MPAFDRERWRAVSPYLERALDMEPDDLASWLASVRAERPEVAGDLEALLADRDALSRDGFLESAEPWLSTAAEPDSIGPYRLIRRLGEGGMGIVYLAEQTGPIRREVALKLIRPGLDSDKVLARFSVERQILANMNHIGVSKVYDANVTPDGRPYVAMEYVSGASLTAFCDDRRLTVRERLELVLQVCAAIQHAHQKGVIHRDIKPSNILVSLVDGKPLVKVIDFGIAKALEAQPGDALLTQTGTTLGTPEYMSPEAAIRGSGDVDTRSDVYALGVVLYELLAGARPFELMDAPGATPLALLESVRDKEPPKLEGRILSSEKSPVALALLRGTDLKRLLRQLEGELEWITFKALEKQPGRRYASAAELAADIERHLKGEPVLAGRPSTLYRLSKLARRHRIAAAALSMVAITILAGAIISSLSLLRAKRAEGAARQELRVSLINQAVTLTGSSELDRRTRALAALGQAAAIRPGLDARNAAIASLLTPGFHVVRQFSPYEPDVAFVWPDATLRRYARAHADGAITIHAIEDDSEILRLPPVRVAADVGLFSPDGRWLAVDYHDHELRIWDLAARTNRRLLENVGSYRFTPDSRRLVARSEKHGHLFDLVSGDERSWPEDSPLTDGWPAVHPSDPAFALTSVGSREIRVRDARSGVEGRRLAVPDLGLATAWSADGTSLITTHADFSVRVWNWPAMGMPRLILRFHGSEPTHLATDPSGRWLATSGWDNKIGIFDLADGGLLLSERGTVVDAARDRAAFVFGNGHAWSLVELEPPFALESIAWPEKDKGPLDVAWSRDGRWLASAGPGGVKVLDRSSGTIASFLDDEYALRVAFRDDSSELRAITKEHIRAWSIAPDAASGEPRFVPRNLPGDADRPSEGRVVGGVSGDGERWISLAVEPKAHVSKWSFGRYDSARIETAGGLAPEDNGPELSSDGRWLAWGNWHGAHAAARGFDVAGPPVVWPIGQTAAVAFSPDNRKLVVGGPSSIRFFDVGTWHEAATMPRRPISPMMPAFTFSHDSRICAAVLPPDRLVLIDAASGEELASMPANQSVFARLAFSPDDRLLAVASVDHHVLIWDIAKLRGELRRLDLDWAGPSGAAER